MDRYTLTKSPEDLAERFTIELPESYKPAYNVSPSRLMPVITLKGKGGFSYFYWGLHPGMAKNRSISRKLYNAFTEEIAARTSFKNALKTDRCIIPSDGYYAWKQVSKKGSIPYRITRSDGECFSFPGIWEEFEDPEGNIVHTFNVIVTSAPSSLRHLGETVPVMFTEKEESAWLNETTRVEDLLDILRPPSQADLYIYSVSPKVNRIDIDSPEVIQPAPAADQFGNYSLFE